MKFVEIDNQKTLNSFVASNNQSQFLQSWQWGEFQTSLGFKVDRIGLEDDDGQLIIAATIIDKKIGFNKGYFFCPRGPVMDDKYIDNVQALNLFLAEVTKVAKNRGKLFLRMEPTVQTDFSSSNFSFVKTIDIEPKSTAVLDLEQTQTDILQKMHQKTRYNIRLAEKRGVQIEEASKEDFDKFWKLMKETGKRDGFGTHLKKYYQQSLEIDFMKLYFAKFKGEVISAGIFSFFGDTATYVHGASAYQYRNLMAPYLLQWAMIQKAKKEGFKYYDFFGTDEKKWPGVTRFKTGFSGDRVDYQGTLDVVFNATWYSIYKIIRKIRRLF